MQECALVNHFRDSWPRQVYPYIGDKPARPPRQYDYAIGKQDRFIDVMGDHDDDLCGSRAQLQQLQAEFFPREGIKRAEGLVQEPDLRLLHHDTTEGHALRHPAGQLRRIRQSEALQLQQGQERSDRLITLLGRETRKFKR